MPISFFSEVYDYLDSFVSYDVYYNANLFQVKQNIKKAQQGLLNLNAPPEGDRFLPLSSVFLSRGKNKIKAAILLLEAGALPHLPDREPGHYIIHRLINCGELRCVRLLLWFDPNYENLISMFREIARERVREWDMDYPGVEKIVVETADDSRKVFALRAEIAGLESKEHYFESAQKYQLIAGIYKHQSEVEKNLKALDFYRSAYPENDAKYREDFIHFYVTKTQQYLELAFTGYEKTYRRSEAVLQTHEVEQQQLKCVKALADIARDLKRPPEAMSYSQIAARLIRELNPEIISAHQISKNRVPEMLAIAPEKEDELVSEYAPLLSSSSPSHFSNHLRQRMATNRFPSSDPSISGNYDASAGFGKR